jgi:hypothetical protein
MGDSRNIQVLTGSKKRWIVVLSILLGICLFLSLISISANQTVLNFNFYPPILQSEDFYNRLPDLIAETATASIYENSEVPQWISRDQLAGLIKTVIPVNWLESQTTEILHNSLSFVNLKSDTLSFTIDLSPVKQNLAGTAGKEAIIAILAGYPACSVEQLSGMVSSMQNGRMYQQLCNPPQEVLPFIEMALDPIMAGIPALIPASVTITANE